MNAAAPPLDVPPLLDGRYRVDRKIAEGGFGAVYAGAHLSLGTKVAIKIMAIDPRMTDEEHDAELARFMEEGRLLTRLRHPGIVAALDLGVLPPTMDLRARPYLVMEWVDGATLHAHMQAYGRAFTLDEAWRLFEPLCDALAHAHAARVVHRDLTPANVMVVHDARGHAVPRVIDFGVGKTVGEEDKAGQGSTQTATPNPFTPAYAAPEQVTFARSGPWTDVHALGLLLVQMLVGRPPYGRTPFPRQEAVDPDRPTPRAFGVDAGALEPVIARALALRPADRYATAGDLLAAARTAMSAPRPIAVAPPFVTESPASRTLATPSPSSSRRTFVALSVVAGIAAASGVASLVVVPRLRNARAPVGPASAPLPPAGPPRGLASLYGPSLDTRLAALGEKVENHTDGTSAPRFTQAIWIRDAVSWQALVEGLLVVDSPDKTHAQAHLDAVAGVVGRFRASQHVAYAADEATVVLIMTSTRTAQKAARATEIVSKLTGDASLLVRGDNFGGADPAAAREAFLRDAPPTAQHLEGLFANELAVRLRRAGVEVETVAQSTATLGMVFFRRGAAQGQAYAYRKDGKATLPGFLGQPGPKAYKAAGDAFLLIMGDPSFANEAFLAKVATGLDGEVRAQGR